jgi:hypothetical protein
MAWADLPVTGVLICKGGQVWVEDERPEKVSGVSNAHGRNLRRGGHAILERNEASRGDNNPSLIDQQVGRDSAECADLRA